MPASRHVIVSLGGMEAGGIRAITSRRKARTAKMRLAIYANTFELHISFAKNQIYKYLPFCKLLSCETLRTKILPNPYLCRPLKFT